MTLLLDPVYYLIPIVWIGAVFAVTLSGRAIPTWVMTAAAFAAVAAQAALISPWTALGSALGAGLLFAVLGITGATTRTTTVAITPVLAVLPVLAWVALLPGLVIAAVDAAVRLKKTLGTDYVNMMAGETLAAMGNKAGKPGKPDLSRIPMAPRDSRAAQVKTPLLPALIVGLVMTAALAVAF